MKIYQSLEEARRGEFRNPVVTLGVFDGVHVGHRYVIDECTRLASERGGQSVVITFKIHPRAVIAGEAPKLITSIGHRLALFSELGVDHCVVLSFDEDLRRMPARDFASLVFEETVGAEVVILGHNCAFGEGREGTFEFLQEHGDAFSFEARQAREVRIGETSLSSSVIRDRIIEGDLDAASSMLGRPFSVYGSVVKGDGRGGGIGFPTANLDLHHELRPPRGVYGCRAIIDGREYFALTNIGVRPTFVEGSETGDSWEHRDRFDVVEAHLLDYSGDLYGRNMELMFLVRLRDEQKFESVEALLEQIQSDREAFLAYLDKA